MTRRSAERYSDVERTEALTIADEHGAAEASRQTGIAAGTIRRWRHEAGRSGPPSNVDPETWAQRKSAAAEETWDAARAALARVHELLGGDGPRSEREAKDAALTLAILLDKSAALEQSSAWLHERRAKFAADQLDALAAALGGVLDDLRLPRTPEVMAVIAHHLRPLEDPDAPTGSAPDAERAAEALRAAVRAELPPEPRSERSESPMLALPAGHIESVSGEVVDDSPEPSTPSADDAWNRSAGPARVGF